MAHIPADIPAPLFMRRLRGTKARGSRARIRACTAPRTRGPAERSGRLSSGVPAGPGPLVHSGGYNARHVTAAGGN